MGQLQLVRVSKWILTVNLYYLSSLLISGTCFDLPPLMNGVITYNAGPADCRPLNTIATFTCDNGYTRTGEIFRVCQNDGTWNGSAPTCQGEFCYCSIVCVSIDVRKCTNELRGSTFW